MDTSVSEAQHDTKSWWYFIDAIFNSRSSDLSVNALRQLANRQLSRIFS